MSHIILTSNSRITVCNQPKKNIKKLVSLHSTVEKNVKAYTCQIVESDTPHFYCVKYLKENKYSFIFKHKTQVKMCSFDFFKQDIEAGLVEIVGINILNKKRIRGI